MLILTALVLGTQEPFIFISDARTIEEFHERLESQKWIKTKDPAFLKVQYSPVRNEQTGQYVDSNGNPVTNEAGQFLEGKNQNDVALTPEIGFMLKGNLTYDASRTPVLNTAAILSVDILETDLAALYQAQVGTRYNEYEKRNSSIKTATNEEMQQQIIISGGSDGGNT